MRILLKFSCISFRAATRVKYEADLSCVAAVEISNGLMGILVPLVWQRVGAFTTLTSLHGRDPKLSSVERSGLRSHRIVTCQQPI